MKGVRMVRVMGWGDGDEGCKDGRSSGLGRC